jgi:hypothetical protein
MIRGVLKRQTGISLIGVRMSNCIADLPLCSSQIKINRKYDLPNLAQGTRFCLYYYTKASRHAGQMIYLKPAASPSDSRQLVMLMHSHRKISDSRGINLLAERDLGSVPLHQEQLKENKMRISDQRMYPRRQGRHHIAEHSRDGRRSFDLQIKVALTLAKNDDRSSHTSMHQQSIPTWCLACCQM